MSAEIYKCLIVGPRNVGKSSIIRRYLEDAFQETYTATIGVGMNVASLEFPEGKVVLSLVDLGGQQSFAALRNRFYQGAHFVMVVYDVTDRETFDSIPKWVESLNQTVCTMGNSIVGALIANKVDKESERVISEAEGRQLAGVLSLDYFETSAKTGQNISEMFIHAASSSRRNLRDASLSSEIE
ncbi:MAG: Rab family GTPase [Candidatus Thorarchaeota archaeon]